uniref:Self-incompatibility associated ribonuclease n=1 Tax=Prunus persica TaxID=3760 RepID=E2S090_PRUPE|nr:self-incompatibility associated ribonuclease [Prunus persica]
MGMLKSSLAFLVLVFAFFFCYVMSSGSYDYFQFVQQWPPTNCRVRVKRPCSNPRPLQYFTIHGLWPSNYSNPKMPSNCTGSQFKKQNLYPYMQSKLKISWPDVESGNDTKFWEGEWNKHGTCSERTLNLMQYFQRSHAMWKSHNITEILKNASIVPHPTKTWKYSDIESPIKRATKRTPVLRCKRDPVQANTQLLHEVVFYYEYDALKLIDCNRTDCWNNVDIKFQ